MDLPKRTVRGDDRVGPPLLIEVAVSARGRGGRAGGGIPKPSTRPDGPVSVLIFYHFHRRAGGAAIASRSGGRVSRVERVPTQVGKKKKPGGGGGGDSPRGEGRSGAERGGGPCFPPQFLLGGGGGGRNLGGGGGGAVFFFFFSRLRQKAILVPPKGGGV